MVKYDDYKDEILSLLATGKSTDTVASEMSGRYGMSFIGRSIRLARNRWTGSDDPSVATILQDKGHDPSNWSHAWLKSPEGTIFIKNKENLVSISDIREGLIGDLSKYSPKFEPIPREEYNDPHCLVIDIADLHIGKYASMSESGETYDSGKAVALGIQGVAGVLAKSSGFNIDQIVFVIGNDVLHTDGAHSTTTSGTRQDVDKAWHENFQLAKKMYIAIIESLIAQADVHIVHNPSNHDYVVGYLLADTVYSWFKNHPNVTFDVSIAHRKYYRYGNNLIGTSHGDGAKMEDTPLLMANEAPRDWADTKYRYIYLHHLHHMRKTHFLSGRDYHGVAVEYLRSPSYTDSWHHRNGYQHAPKAVSGFIHSKEMGQVARITHLFK